MNAELHWIEQVCVSLLKNHNCTVFLNTDRNHIWSGIFQLWLWNVENDKNKLYPSQFLCMRICSQLLWHGFLAAATSYNSTLDMYFDSTDRVSVYLHDRKHKLIRSCSAMYCMLSLVVLLGSVRPAPMAKNVSMGWCMRIKTEAMFLVIFWLKYQSLEHTVHTDGQ